MKFETFYRVIYDVRDFDPAMLQNTPPCGGWFCKIPDSILLTRDELEKIMVDTWNAAYWKGRADLGDLAKLTNYPDKQQYLSSILDKK